MKKLLLFALVIALAFCCCITASAAKTAIDLNKTGSLTVTMECSHGYRSDGKVELYYLAELTYTNNKYGFKYTQEFADCPLDLANISDATKADAVYDYLTNKGLEGVKATLTDGVAVYNNLPTGLYLVVQAESGIGFSTAMPFFVTIPVQSGDNWVYNVDAEPKIEITHSELQHPPGIPETGQLKWPIPIMAASGLIIFAIGAILLKRNKRL